MAAVDEGSKRNGQLQRLAIYELTRRDKHATPLAVTKMASLCTLRCLLAPTDKLKAVEFLSKIIKAEKEHRRSY